MFRYLGSGSQWTGLFAVLMLIAINVSPLLAAQVVTELDIKPDTCYELKFEVSGLSKQAQATIHMSDAQGLLHYDGVRTGQDYILTPDQQAYHFGFLSSQYAARLKLIVSDDRAKISQVELKEAKPQAMVLNGDLSLPSFIGWPQRSNWIERATHKDLPAIRVNTNGYALSEFIPVQGGAGYRIQGWPSAAVMLAYDKNKRFIAKVPNVYRVNPPFTAPTDAAYFRILLQTGHSHIPAYATVHAGRLSLMQVIDPPAKKEQSSSAAKSKPFMEIILAPGSDGREETAARELQHWIFRITSALPPVLAEPSRENRLRVFVGSAFAEEFQADLKALADSDGYAVRRKGKNIYVFGHRSRGTLYGVHALLEKNSDIIWPRPNPMMEVVYSTRDTLDFSNADFISRPAFWGRYISNSYGGGNKYEFQRWFARNGINSAQSIHTGFDYVEWMFGSEVGYNGSFLSWSGANESTPDLYPLVDGVRDVSRWRQPCLTHPDLVPRIVERIRARYQLTARQGIEAQYIHITLSDNWTVCSCDRCMTPIDLPGGKRLEPKSAYATKDPLFFSTRVFIMLNEVAKALENDFPDLKLQTHAYIFTAEPPAVKIHPNIIPQFAAYPTQNVRYPIVAGKGNVISSYDKDIWRRRFTQWAQLNHNLGYFGYYYVSGFNALADTAAADYRDLLKAGGIQAHTEGFPTDADKLTSWDLDAIEKWTIVRLLWDPNQDPAELRKQFIERVYGPAAPAMTQFHDMIRKAWHAPDDSVMFNCHSSDQSLFNEIIVKQGLEDSSRALLVKAQQAARNPAAKMFVDRQLAQFDNLKQRFGRHEIPHVEESKNEWLEASSPHWEKAMVLKDFYLVDDWRQFKRKPAEHQTTLRLMHDRKNLYVMFTAQDNDLSSLVMPARSGAGVFPQGDRVELVIRVNEKDSYFLAAGPNGTFYSLPKVKGQVANSRSTNDDAWIAIMAIPLEDLKWSAEQPVLEILAGRIYRHDPAQKQESTLKGVSLFNRYGTFWTKAAIAE